MKKKAPLKPEENETFKLYAETLDEVVKMCLENGAIKGERYQNRALESAILKICPDARLTAKFITDLRGDIKTALGKINQEQIGIREESLRPLLLLAGIEDIRGFDKKFRRSSFLVAYSPHRYGLFEIPRITQSGYLKLKKEQWYYESAGKDVLAGELRRILPVAMAGDRKPYWLEVQFVANGQVQYAYFGEYEDFSLKVQEGNTRLIAFFTHFLPR